MIAFCCSLDPDYAFNRFMCGDTACTSHTDSGETFGEDEGFDQGGLRKAWIALIATHFVRSDLSNRCRCRPQIANDLCTLHWKQVLSPACLLFCIKGKVR